MVLQRFPNKASLAMAVHKELGSSQGKKKMSRLKRIILRERADKAAVQAASAADLAAANLVKSKSALDCLQKQLKVTDKPFVGCAHGCCSMGVWDACTCDACFTECSTHSCVNCACQIHGM